MNAKFLAWKHEAVDGGATLNRIQGIPDAHELRYGTPRAKDFPDDATIEYDPERPRDNLAMDSFLNSHSKIFASERLVGVLKAQNVKWVEYLPITVLDHKKKPLKTPYYIVHPIGLVDCLDVAASGGMIHPMDPSEMLYLDQLVLREADIPEDRDLFRVKQFPHEIIVRKSLADAIDAAGVTGVRWAMGRIYD